MTQANLISFSLDRRDGGAVGVEGGVEEIGCVVDVVVSYWSSMQCVYDFCVYHLPMSLGLFGKTSRPRSHGRVKEEIGNFGPTFCCEDLVPLNCTQSEVEPSNR
jgi:hypothetical protein